MDLYNSNKILLLQKTPRLLQGRSTCRKRSIDDLCIHFIVSACTSPKEQHGQSAGAPPYVRWYFFVHRTLNLRITDQDDCDFVGRHELRDWSGSQNSSVNDVMDEILLRLWLWGMVDETLYSKNVIIPGLDMELILDMRRRQVWTISFPHLFYCSITTRTVVLREVVFAFTSTCKQTNKFIVEVCTAAEDERHWRPRRRMPVDDFILWLFCIFGCCGIHPQVHTMIIAHHENLSISNGKFSQLQVIKIGVGR